MKRLFQIIVLVGLSAVHVKAQVQDQRYLGVASGTEVAVATATLSGGNRVIVGSRSDAASGFDALITCVTPTNVVLWSKVVSTAANDRFTSVCATSDGGCVAVGFVNQNTGSPYSGNEACVYKFNASGTELWHQTIKATTNGEIFRSVIEVPGSGEIICAGNYSYGSPNLRGLLANFSSSGTINWIKNYSSGFYDEIHTIKYLSGKIICGAFYRTGVGAKWITNIFAASVATGLPIWNRSYTFVSAFDPTNDGQYTGMMSIVDSNIYLDVYLSGGFGGTGSSPALLTVDTTGANPFVFEYPITGFKFTNAISSHVSPDRSVILVQHPGSGTFDKNFGPNPSAGITEAVFTRIKNVRNAAGTHVYTREIATTGTQAVLGGEMNGTKFNGVGIAKGDVGKSIGSLDIYKLSVDTSFPSATSVCIQDRSGQLFANLPVAYNPTFTFSSVSNVTLVTPLEGTVSPITQNIVQTCAFKNLTPDFTFVRTACLQDSFTDITATLSKGIQSWYWTFGDGGTSTAKNPTHTYASFGTYTVKLVVTDSLGEKDSISKSVDMKSYRFLTVTKSAYACQDALPASVPLSATGGRTYSWTPVSGLSSPSSGSPTAVVTAPITYIVSSTDSLGCTDQDTTIISVLNAKVTIQPDSGRACVGAAFPLKVSGASTYKWSPSLGLSADTGAAPVARINASTTYIVTGTDANGCKGADTIQLTAVPSPKVVIADDSLEICQYAYTTVTASGASVYKWTPKGTALNDSLDTFRLKVDSNFYLKVRGWNADGCEGSDSLYLYTKPSPKVEIFCEDPTVGCGGETFVDASGANQYEWWPREYFSDPSGSTSKVSLTRTSLIYVRGTIPNGCTGTDSLQIRFDNESWVQIPNAFTPNGDGVNDNIRPIIVCNFFFLEFAIYNRWGQQVFFDVANNAPWNGTFNGRECEAGIYYYYVKGKDASGKLITLKGDIALIR